MGWLADNWIWIVLGVVVFVLLGRGRWYGRGGMSHHGYGGTAHGGSGYQHDQGTRGPEPGGAYSPAAAPPGVAIDPVTRQDVSTAAALTSVYQGRIYYFASAESRQRFEASPAQYAREELGRPLAGPERPGPPPRQGGGCC